MNKTPKYDAKVKEILDGLQPGQEMVCPLSGKTWLLDEKEIEICRKYNVPPSKVEPETRLDYLSGFNTGFALWWKKDIHGKVIMSSVHPDSEFSVMSDVEWDNTNFLDKGFDYQLDQLIWDQLWKLRLRVPEKATRSTASENTIGIASYRSIDSYMACGSMVNRCHYTYAMVNGEDSVDVANGEQITRSFRVNGSQNIVDCEYVFESVNCLNASFLFDCWNCEKCFGATNKRNKKFLWFNEQLSEEEWNKRRADVDLSCYSTAKKFEDRFHDLIRNQAVWPESFSFKNEDSNGERVLKCVRCEDCFWMIDSVDMYRARLGLGNEGCAYVSGPGWAKDTYMSTGTAQSANNRFCIAGQQMNSCEYSAFCVNCEYCFGCMGLKRSRYCIFNKQFTEDEYWEKIDDIKCQMLDDGIYGEFWPAKFCSHGFQYSVGQTYFGYSDEQLDRWKADKFDAGRGLVLSERQIENNPVSVEEIPDCIDEIDSEKHVAVPIHDPELDRDFSVIKSEFEIYKKKRWPFPRQHFISRLTNLIRHSNSPHKMDYKCDSCQVDMVTYKNLKFQERKIYCKDCYLKYLESSG